MKPYKVAMQKSIDSLGECLIDSPLTRGGRIAAHFVSDDDRVLKDDSIAAFNEALASGKPPESFERAGARKRIFFEPRGATAGIVTCGGLCPGLNDVIRSLVMQLYHRYGVK